MDLEVGNLLVELGFLDCENVRHKTCINYSTRNTNLDEYLHKLATVIGSKFQKLLDYLLMEKIF